MNASRNIERIGSLARQKIVGLSLSEGCAAALWPIPSPQVVELSIQRPGAIPNEASAARIVVMPFGNRAGSKRFRSPVESTQKWMLQISKRQPVARWLSARRPRLWSSSASEFMKSPEGHEPKLSKIA